MKGWAGIADDGFVARKPDPLLTDHDRAILGPLTVDTSVLIDLPDDHWPRFESDLGQMIGMTLAVARSMNKLPDKLTVEWIESTVPSRDGRRPYFE